MSAATFSLVGHEKFDPQRCKEIAADGAVARPEIHFSRHAWYQRNCLGKSGRFGFFDGEVHVKELRACTASRVRFGAIELTVAARSGVVGASKPEKRAEAFCPTWTFQRRGD